MTALVAAVAAALVAAVVLLVAPLYESGDTLLQANGTGSLVLILGPLALASVPLLVAGPHRFRTAGAVGLVLIFASFVSSAGIFFLPAAIGLVVAWRLGEPTAGTA